MTSIAKRLRSSARILAVLALTLLLLHPSIAAALDEATRGLLFPMYGENAGVCSGENFGSSTPGIDNEETIFRFFLSRGLTPHQTAGIMGNIRQESSFNPKAQQDGSKDPFPKNGVGFGLVQWTFTGRQQPLVRLAAKANKPATDINVQLTYIWNELNGGYKENTLEPLKRVRSAVKHDAVREATIIFHDGYERSADGPEGINRRVGYSKDSLALMIERGVVKKGDEDKVVAGAIVGEGCSGAIIIDGYAWPRAPKQKSAYSKGVLPLCKNPVMNKGPWNSSYPYARTRGGNYTDMYRNTTPIKTCHHDGTPAFDLMANGGEEVYAITDGYIINRSGGYGGVSGCYSIQFKSVKEAGGFYYWYGHMENANLSLPIGDPDKPNKNIVKAGTRIANIATESKGSACWLGGVHLHIDSGCVDKNGTPHQGGNDWCRRPGFLDQLGKLYEALPS